ncbi:hypothetical protein F4782DRAFT_277501 [Xylaria castorea]|nr:hypothetical protein F4782DRAFT_277501 [Xylaria castorea]
MIDLLLDCAIFLAIDVGTNNVCQISGRTLSSVPLYVSVSSKETSIVRTSSELVFIRSRMFYAKPALNTRGQVQFGLRHIHVLNRSPFQQLEEGGDLEIRTRFIQQNDVHTLKVMMYIFPRQFGLHNVFTSTVDPKETSQRLKDYTLREEEIYKEFGRLGDNRVHMKTPRRLRGRAKDLVRRLQVLHQRCSYSRLLQHYCPVCPSSYRASVIINTDRSVYLRMNLRFNQNLIRFKNKYENQRTGQVRMRHDLRDRSSYHKEVRSPRLQNWQPRLLRCPPSARLFLRR